MVTPLHVQISMHYHCKTDQHPMLYNEVHCRYAYDLVAAGLLEKTSEFDPDADPEFAKTDGLAVWIAAICSVPFPVQQWAIPSTPSPQE